LLQAVDSVSFSLAAGEVLAIVGESGSGKSVTAQTIMGLTRSNNARIEGSVQLDGEELTTASDADMRRLRGERVAMIFQDPMTSFNPVYRLGAQVAEALLAHRPETSKAIPARARRCCGVRDARLAVGAFRRKIQQVPERWHGVAERRRLLLRQLVDQDREHRRACAAHRPQMAPSRLGDGGQHHPAVARVGPAISRTRPQGRLA